MSTALTAGVTLISIVEAARILDLNESRVYRLVRSGKFPPGVVTLLGRKRIRFNEEKLHRWKSQHEQFISVAEAAKLLDADPKVIRDGVRSGLYASPIVERTAGGRILFHRNKLIDWIENGGNYAPTHQEILRDFNALADRERQRRASGGYDGRQQ
jgi:excisionase family DNA binding protein